MRWHFLQGKGKVADKEQTMSLIQQRTPLSNEEEYKYAKLAMEWYGWGSPIGLGILLVALAAAAVLVRVAVYGL
jgi:hypothetical protein